MDRKGDQAKIIKSINEKLAKEMKTPENMKQLAELMGKAQQENLDKVNINLNTDKTAVSIDGTGLKNNFSRIRMRNYSLVHIALI